MTKEEILKTYYGYDAFRPGQDAMIDALLAGRDALAIMPTGAGKSVCYQVPALLLPGITLVAKSFRLQEKAPLVSFNFDGIGSAEAAAYLSDRGFALRGGLHCAGLAHRSLGTVEQGAVRFSPSSFNNTRQVSAFLEEVKKIQKNGQLRG